MNSSSDTPTPPRLLVGIGASAGGLDALKRFFSTIPVDSGLAFIVVLHLDPNHKSMLSEILSRESKVRICEGQNGDFITANTAYIVPPGCYIEVLGDTIGIRRVQERHGSRKAVDQLFRSMAEYYGAHGVGVVLTGAGSDGTAGLRALKAAGGLAIAQDPQTAEYDSMPLSAINAGVVDQILRVEVIGEVVLGYSKHPFNDLSEQRYPEKQIQKIRTLLAEHENLDLSQYKESTVKRRICRRLSLTDAQTVAEYVDLLHQSEEERQQLLRDLMINVTDFFRDRQAFDELDRKIISALVEKAEDRSDIRVWVPGCASGEEAYSIAILLLERIERCKKRINIRIFATDVDEDAIKIARRGVYSESIIAELPRDYVQRYFTKLDSDYYKINSVLRDRISFATQNVYGDPPFSKMDLISCRNLLIYLKREAQDRVLQSFYFSLKPGGYLFLGSSESIGNHKNFFKQISQKWRIFQRDSVQGQTRNLHARVPGSAVKGARKKVPENQKKQQNDVLGDKAKDLLLRHVPPTVIVGGDNRIVYVHGNINEFVQFPEGEPKFDFVQMLAPNIRTRVRNGMFKARRSQEKVEIKTASGNEDGEHAEHALKINIYGVLGDEFGPEAVVISFDRISGMPDEQRIKWKNISIVDQEKIIESVEQELLDTREELQNTIEELETSTEELRASNEEALSTNEELQSANEELEASTEELRSLNEELTIVNSQLKEKVTELEHARNDLENFFSSTNLATLFLDSDFKIKRFTPAAEQLLKIGVQDLDRPISNISRKLINENTVDEARRVFSSLNPSRQEIKTEDGAWFVRAILPYQTEEKHIDGVVVTFSDITEFKRTMLSLEARERQHSVIAKLGLKALMEENVSKLLAQVIREVAHVLDADFAKVLRYLPESDEFEVMSHLGFSEVENQVTRLPGGQQSLPGYTLKEEHPVIVRDIHKEKRFSVPQILFDHQVVGSLSCVINNGSQPYGVLALHTKSLREFTREDANFLTSIANLLSSALHRRQAEERVKSSEQRLDLARKVADIGIHDHNLSDGSITLDKQIRTIWGFGDDVEKADYSLFESAIAPEDRSRVKEAFDSATAAGGERDFRLEYRVINRRDHKPRWVESTGRAFFDGDSPVRLVGTVRDITHRKRTELELFNSEQKLRIAKDSNKFGAFLYDVENGEMEWDKILKDIWGVPKDQTPTLDVFYKGLHPDDVKPTEERIATALDPQGTGHYFATYRVINMKTGFLSWVEASGQVVFDEGKPKRMIGMIIDITERKSLEESLQSAIEKLGTENKKKNEFIATLGHELRNPLAAINSGLQILDLKKEDSQWALDMMSKNVRLICSLLDDLLDLTRITMGKIQLKKSRIDVRALLSDLLRSFESKIREKRQTLDRALGETAVYVDGDATRLEQVFSNILTNAQKFTPEGGTIAVRLEQHNGSVAIAITDNGVGIPSEKLEMIFDPFEQVIATGSIHSGLGIGLSLVQQFVQMHDGTVDVTSAGENQGSTFTVSLPVAAQSTPEKPLAPTEQPVLKSQLKVLVVDDNEDAARGLQAMLESHGCSVLSVYDGRSALEAIARFDPEVFILDIGLPDMDGYELCGNIRTRFERAARYIALTGYSPSTQEEKQSIDPFDAHLTKPANFIELLQLLSEVD